MGVKVPFGSPTVTYHGNVKYVYNPEWMHCDFENTPTNTVYAIVALWSGGLCKFAFQANTVSGQYTVNWGDGTTETYDGSTTVTREHAYDFDTCPTAVTSLGYKTVLVTITGNLNLIEFWHRPSGYNYQYMKSNILGLSINLPNLSSISIFRSSTNTFEWYPEMDIEFFKLFANSITTLNYFTYGCYFDKLQYFDVDLSSATNASTSNIFAANSRMFSILKYCNIDISGYTGSFSVFQYIGSISSNILSLNISGNSTSLSAFQVTASSAPYNTTNEIYLMIKPNLTTTSAFSSFFSSQYGYYSLSKLRIYNLKTGTGCRALQLRYNQMNREAFMDFVTNYLPDLTTVSATGALHIEYSLAALQLTSEDIAVINALGWTVYT